MSEGASGAAGAAVLVYSCDRFFDVWRPFAGFWRKFWPRETLGWPVYLIVNELAVRSDQLTPLAVGPYRSWAENLRRALAQIDAEYVLYLQEDYFLTAPARADTLTALLARMRAEGADLLCLRAMRPGFGAEDWPRVPDSGGLLSEIPAGSPWRARLQAALWRRGALLEAMRADESPWDFEARAGERLRGLRAWTVAGERGNDALPYLPLTAIERGLWMPATRRLCAEHGVRLEPECRGSWSPSRYVCRWRRAIDRLRLPLARWRQRRMGVIEL